MHMWLSHSSTANAQAAETYVSSLNQFTPGLDMLIEAPNLDHGL